MKNKSKVLTSFALTMISVTAIVNLRNLPIMASAGLGAIFFYTLAALVFLIPSAFVSAELASTWPEAGGVYLWVQKAFGNKLGLFAIWSEWFNNVIGFPTTLSFIAATILYVFFPQMEQHKMILFILILVILWSCTFFNFLGIKASSQLNIIGALFGSIIPAALIIVLTLFWISSHHPIQMSLNWHTIFPGLKIKHSVFFLGVLLGYAGMQITAFHAPNVKNPRRDFPKAIILATIIIIVITLLGSLAIATVVPSKNLSLVTGVMESFSAFFKAFHLYWALPILALLLMISGISTLTAWLLAPARGLAVAAKQGLFPKWCAHENKKGMPTHLLIIQAIIATLLALLFLFTSSINEAFWLLIVLTSQFTLIMYILIFASALRLRYKYTNIIRPFKIPGGKISIWLITIISILICIAGFLLGYFPPDRLKIHSVFNYEAVLIFGNLIYIGLPFAIYKSVKK